MKVSYNWLKEHLPLELSATELGAHLLKIGFEIAGHTRLGPTFTGVVTDYSTAANPWTGLPVSESFVLATFSQ